MSEMDMRALQPVKMRKTNRVLGYLYRVTDDGTIQYVSFSSRVVSISSDKIALATPEELEREKNRQRAKGLRG